MCLSWHTRNRQRMTCWSRPCLLCGSWGLNSGRQTWRQAPLASLASVAISPAHPLVSFILFVFLRPGKGWFQSFYVAKDDLELSSVFITNIPCLCYHSCFPMPRAAPGSGRAPAVTLQGTSAPSQALAPLTSLCPETQDSLGQGAALWL